MTRPDDEVWVAQQVDETLDGGSAARRMARQDRPRSSRMLGLLLVVVAGAILFGAAALVLADIAHAAAASPSQTTVDPGAGRTFAVLALLLIAAGALAFGRRRRP